MGGVGATVEGRAVPIGSPFEDRVDGGAAGVDLEGVGEHDEDDDSGFADCGGDARAV